MLDSVPDFGLGETLKGTNDAGQLVNSALEGREYTFPVTEELAVSLGMPKRVVGTRIVARIVRNTSGAALLPGTIALCDIANKGVEGLGQVAGLSTAKARFAYPVDAAIPAAGCADDDLCYVIVGGVAKVKQPESAATLAVGDYIAAGASGRLVEEGTPASNSHTLLGTALEANSTNDALVTCYIHPAWESK